MRLAAPQQFLARERTAIEEAWPGDVIGVIDRGTLRIGDTLSSSGDVEFSGIPRFAPEHFARIIADRPDARKQLDAGLRQLTEEGAAQVFFTRRPRRRPDADHRRRRACCSSTSCCYRLEHEYGVPCRLERMSCRYPRWVTGPKDEIERVARDRGRMRLYDAKNDSIIVFDDV